MYRHGLGFHSCDVYIRSRALAFLIPALTFRWITSEARAPGRRLRGGETRAGTGMAGVPRGGSGDGVTGGGQPRPLQPGAFHTTAVIPPSTYNTWPLTKSEADEERKTSEPTRSWTRPQRPAGVRLSTQWVKSASSTRAAVSSVAK